MKKYYRKFKKWAEQKRIQRSLNYWIVSVGGVVTILFLGLLFKPQVASVDDWLKKHGLDTFMIKNTDIPPQIPTIVLKNPTPTDNSTPTVTPVVQTYKQTYRPSSNTIDCIGPDGKHLQTTQKECDDFNSAWNNKKNTNNSVPYQQTYPNQNLQLLQNQQSLQNYANHVINNVCTSTAKMKVDTCNGNCNNTNNYNRSACLYAYGTSSSNGYNDAMLTECFSEIGDEYGKCLDACEKSYSDDLHVCSP